MTPYRERREAGEYEPKAVSPQKRTRKETETPPPQPPPQPPPDDDE